MSERFDFFEDILLCSKTVQGLLLAATFDGPTFLTLCFCRDLDKRNRAILECRSHGSWVSHQGIDRDQPQRSLEVVDGFAKRDSRRRIQNDAVSLYRHILLW